MSLITMGYGHATVITMGLGTGFRIVSQKMRRQWGKVTYEGLPTQVTIEETTPEVKIRED